MRFPVPTNRTVSGALAAGVAIAALTTAAGCNQSNLPVPAYAKDLPRLYVSSVKYRVRGELVSSAATKSDLTAAIDELVKWRELGTFMSPAYVITVDPEIILQTTTNRDIPATEFVDSTTFTATGTTTTQKVLKNPLFYLDYVEVKHTVPGYTLPTRTYNLNLAMRQTSVVIDHLPVSNADDVVKALWDKPDTTPPAVGTADITIYGRDMDPLLAEKKVVPLATRSFPVRYMYGSALLGESVQNETPLVAPQPAIFATPAPSASPTATPSATPTATPAP